MAKRKGDDEIHGGGAYFRPPSTFKRFSSGCTGLDLVLGGGWGAGLTINLVGDSAGGKCVKNGYVIRNGSTVLLDDWCEKFQVEGEYPIKPASLALSKTEKVSATHLYAETVKKTVMVRTSHGFEIEATPEHPIMVWSPECRFEMKKMKDISKGDVCVIAPGPFPVPNQPAYARVPAVACHPSGKNCEIKGEMDESFAELLGFFIADGCFMGNSFLITSGKKWSISRIAKRMHECFGVVKGDGFSIKWEKNKTAASHICTRKQAAATVAVLCGLGAEGPWAGQLTAAKKSVPSSVLAGPASVQKAFLRALLSCDGCEAHGGWSYMSASKRLVQQVQLMLLSFGIVSSWHVKKSPKGYEDRTYYRLSIYGPNAALFAREVGLLRPHGIVEKGKHHSSYGSVPYLPEFLTSALTGLRRYLRAGANGVIPNSGKQRFPRCQFTSGVTLSRLGDFVELFQKYAEPLGDVFKLVQKIIDNNYHFDAVVVREMKSEKTRVYDVHVPDGHLFWCNGFVSHNTLLAIEGGANFARQYPKGRVKLIDAEGRLDPAYADYIGFPKTAEILSKNDITNTVQWLEKDLKAFIASAPKKTPSLYILDSLDAISTEKEQEVGSEATMDVYLQKAKLISGLFRTINNDLGRKQITFFVVSQTRTKMGVSFGNPKTRAGGDALEYYSSQIVWLKKLGKIEETKQKVSRKVGHQIKATCTKLSTGIAFRDFEFPIRFGYGVDDLAANVEWLADPEVRGVAKIGLNLTGDAKEQGKQLGQFVRDTIKLPDDEYHLKLTEIADAVKERWEEIEASFAPKRKKYK